MLFCAPSPSEDELEVIEQIEEMWRQLGHLGQGHRRWYGFLRRSAMARAVRGSNSIEGIHVSIDDALAAGDGSEPLEARGEVWAATICYQTAMTYVLELAQDAHFRFAPELLRSLHFMMVNYDLSKWPGRWRPGDIYVRREEDGEIVYTGAHADEIPSLIDELVESLNARDKTLSPIVHAAMAHLNLIMIHPFRDGNGRMARCLQTLCLARSGTLYPPFASIEEYLGRNTPAYYQALQDVGGIAWSPHRDARPWVRFCIIAHYKQAHTVLRRSQRMDELWQMISDELKRRGLPDRMVFALFDAANHLHVRNGAYRSAAEISMDTASRDLKRLCEDGLLAAHGEKRGRSYAASNILLGLRSQLPEYPTILDPFEKIAARKKPLPGLEGLFNDTDR